MGGGGEERNRVEEGWQQDEENETATAQREARSIPGFGEERQIGLRQGQQCLGWRVCMCVCVGVCVCV